MFAERLLIALGAKVTGGRQFTRAQRARALLRPPNTTRAVALAVVLNAVAAEVAQLLAFAWLLSTWARILLAVVSVLAEALLSLGLLSPFSIALLLALACGLRSSN